MSDNGNNHSKLVDADVSVEPRQQQQTKSCTTDSITSAGGSDKGSSKASKASEKSKESSPMMAACSLDYDKIQTVSPSRTTVRDAFEWDDSGFSLASSEMDQVKESLFEAMRSG